jgi:hypothetical protein
MWSLSPYLISLLAMASFSFTMGTQPLDGLTGVEVLPAVDEVVRNEKHLRGDEPVRRECTVVGGHQSGLADGRQRLQGQNVGGALGEPESGDTGCDRTRRHENDLVAPRTRRCQLRHDRRDDVGADLPPVVRQ